MSSAKNINTKNNKQSNIPSLVQRTKDLFTVDVQAASPFAKELYKQVRNKVKKLDDIQRIEERVKEAGLAGITEEQAEKLKSKDSYMQSVEQTLAAFEIYKATELQVILGQKKEPEAVAVEEAKVETPASNALQKETKQFSTQTNAPGGVEHKVVECSILQSVQTEQKQT